MDRWLEALGATGGIILFVAGLLLFLVQGAAFMQGLETWLGWGLLAQIIIFVLLLMFLREAATLIIAPIGFYGAMYGWGWEWWQAALVCFPSLIWFGLMLTGGSVVALVTAILDKRRTV